MCFFWRDPDTSPVSSFTDLPRVLGSVTAAGFESGSGIAPSGKLPYAFLLQKQINIIINTDLNTNDILHIDWSTVINIYMYHIY